MTRPRMVSFLGDDTDTWRVTAQTTVLGSVPLAPAQGVEVVEGVPAPHGRAWTLRGVTSSVRHLERPEKEALSARQEGLGRTASTRAALVPIRKSEERWELTQEKRRVIFEQQSAHIATGLGYLPTIARRLAPQSRPREPFDVLTWFEYAPADAEAFEELVGLLRETEEWRHVDAEVDLRLERAATA